MSAEDFQKLSYAAGMSDVSVEALEKAYKQLSASGSDLDLTSAIMQVAAIEDADLRAAKATELFGSKTAQELVPLLNEGADGVAALMGEAEQYGMVLSNDAVAAGAAFDDSLGKLQQTMTGVKNSLLGNLFAPLTTCIDGFADLVAGVDGAQEKITEGVNQTVSTVVELLPQVLETASSVLLGILEAITNNLPLILETGSQIVVNLVQGIVAMLPQLLTSGIECITSILQGLNSSLPQLIPVMVSAIVTMVNALLANIPKLIKCALELIVGLAKGLIEAIPELIQAVPTIIESLVDALLEMIPIIAECGMELLISLVNELPSIIASIIAVLPEIIINITTSLLTHLPEIVDCGVRLITALIDDLPTIIMAIVSVLPQIITQIVNTLASHIPEIIQAGVQLLVSLVSALPQIITAVVKAIPQIISALVKAIGGGVSDMANAGLNLIKGLFNGISNSVSWLYGKLKGWVSSVLSYIKGLFGIHSPSKVFAGYGEFLVEGLGIGIEDNTKVATDAMEDLSTEVKNAFDANSNYNFMASGAYDIEEPELLDENGFNRSYRNQFQLETNDSWIDKLIQKLNESGNDKPILIQVDGKTFAQTSISTINQMTKQTGKLDLILV